MRDAYPSLPLHSSLHLVICPCRVAQPDNSPAKLTNVDRPRAAHRLSNASRLHPLPPLHMPRQTPPPLQPAMSGLFRAPPPAQAIGDLCASTEIGTTASGSTDARQSPPPLPLATAVAAVAAVAAQATPAAPAQASPAKTSYRTLSRPPSLAALLATPARDPPPIPAFRSRCNHASCQARNKVRTCARGCFKHAHIPQPLRARPSPACRPLGLPRRRNPSATSTAASPPPTDPDPACTCSI